MYIVSIEKEKQFYSIKNPEKKISLLQKWFKNILIFTTKPVRIIMKRHPKNKQVLCLK